MTTAETEKWLERALVTEKEIAVLQTAKAGAFLRCQPGAQQVGTTGRRSADGENWRLEQYLQTSEQLDLALRRLDDASDEIFRTVMQVPDMTLRLLLSGRYVGRMKWSEIAERLGVEERSVYRMRNRAVECVRRILSGEAVR